MKFKRLPTTFIALATALIMAIMSCGVATAAEAKPVNAVTNINVTTTTMKQYETQTVNVTWAAPNGTHQGDWFTIGLPEELSNSKVSPISLLSSDGKDVADCKLDSKTVTCTFTDYVDTYGSVHGDLGLTIVADHTNDGNKGEWTINGQSDGKVPVPDVGPQDPDALPEPGYFAKGGWGEPQDGNDTVAWEVIIGADKFLVNDPTGDHLITLHDEPDAGLALYPSDQDFHVHIRYANGVEWPKQQWEPELVQGTDYTLSVNSATHSFDVKFNKASPTVTTMIQWAKNRDLAIQMYYYTIPYAPEDNTSYSNTVKGTDADDQDAQYKWTSAWGDGFGVGASVRLVKRDASSRDPLGGAVFDLVSGRDGKGNVVRKGLTSDDEGVVRVDDLYKGDYSFVETKAPAGYQLASKPVNFTVSDATFDGKGVVDLTMDDPRTPGSVSWSKVDSADGSRRLAGSQWKLTGPGDAVETVADNGEHDADATAGVLRVDGLAWGRYTLTETKAPVGYQLSSKPVEFTLDATHTTITLPPIANTRKPDVPVTPVNPNTPPSTPDTPATPSAPAPKPSLATTGSVTAPIVSAALLLVLLAAAITVYRRRHQTR